MDGTLKNVVFVCIGNSCRSQMAEGFLRAYGSDSVNVYSAGTSPAGVISNTTIQVMQERGIDISQQYSKGLEAIDLPGMDVVVTMGCCSADDLCPLSYRGEKLDWDIADPIGQPIEIYRMVRDDIESRVTQFLAKLRTEASPKGPAAKKSPESTMTPPSNPSK